MNSIGMKLSTCALCLEKEICELKKKKKVDTLGKRPNPSIPKIISGNLTRSGEVSGVKNHKREIKLAAIKKRKLCGSQVTDKVSTWRRAEPRELAGDEAEPR